MHFGENQLSRSLISLSPLPTTHPLSFQPKWVRSSTRSYTRFNLVMGRSLRFGSRTRDSTPYSDSLSLRLPHTELKSPTPSLTRRLILQKARSHTRQNTVFNGLWSTRFQIYFTPPLSGYFSPFPHGTDSLSVNRKYLGLPGGPGRFTRESTNLVLLG